MQILSVRKPLSLRNTHTHPSAPEDAPVTISHIARAEVATTAESVNPLRKSALPTAQVFVRNANGSEKMKVHAEQQTEKLTSVMRSCEERSVTSLESLRHQNFWRFLGSKHAMRQ